MRNANHEYGLQAEKIACCYLKQKKFKILQSRYKTKYGEIDIIAQQDNCIIFCEVKARVRLPELINAYQSISSSAHRIQNTALCFVSHRPKYKKHDMRFDIILVLENKIHQHIENAW